MDELFLQIFNTAITAGWLVLAVLVARLLLKKAPAWTRCALWAVVALRLVWPFEIESILSLIPSTQTLPPSQLYDYAPELNTGFSSVDSVINPVFTQTFASDFANSVNPLQVVTIVAGWVWVAGMVVMALYALISYLRLWRTVQVCIPLEKGVYISDGAQTPFILGIICPKIYLPSDLPELSHESILAHERAHLARKDHWWKPLGFFLLSVFWFHPLLWLAYWLLCRDVEQACDEKVIKHLSAEEKKAYSQVLLSCSMPGKWISACPLAFGETGVKGRIKAVLHYKKPTLWIIVAALIVGSILAVCFLTEPGDGTESGKETEIYSASGRHYALQYGDSMIDTLTIAVSPDGRFTYYESMYSSYIGRGTWYQEGDKLYLTDTGTRASRYVFLVEADGIRFVASESTDTFFWANLPDGAKIPLTMIEVNPSQEEEQIGQLLLGTFVDSGHGYLYFEDTQGTYWKVRGLWLSSGNTMEPGMQYYISYDGEPKQIHEEFSENRTATIYVEAVNIWKSKATWGMQLIFVGITGVAEDGFYGEDAKGNIYHVEYSGEIPEDMTQCWVTYYGEAKLSEHGHLDVTAQECWLYREYSQGGIGGVYDRCNFDLDDDGVMDNCVLSANISTSGIFTCKLTVTLADGVVFEAQFHEKMVWDENSGVFIPSVDPPVVNGMKAYADVFAFAVQDGKLVILSPSGSKYLKTGGFTAYAVTLSNGKLTIEAQ